MAPQDPTSTKDVLQAALAYREQGLSIIPIRSGEKEPPISWKEFQGRIASQGEIEGWYQRWPDAGVAIVTGAVSGIIIVDVDPKPGVEDSLRQITLPPTYTVRTGRGHHHYYRWAHSHPAPNVKGYKPGLDLQGEGAYCLAPPSVHKNGQAYVALNDVESMVDAPEWLVLLAKAKQGRPAEVSFDGVGEGQRNMTAARVAGKILRSLPREDWELSGWDRMEEWNSANTPPLPIGELMEVFDSIMKREEIRRSKPGGFDPADITDALSLKELCETEFPATKWAVERLFETGTINMISAPPNEWKSWIALHLARCLASGAPLFGHFRAEKMTVMLVNEEDSSRSIQERVLQLGPGTDEPVFFHTEKGFKLSDAMVARILEEIHDKGVSFVIFDTFRSIHSEEENSSTEMTRVMDQLKKFTRDGVTVLLTHHNRKKQGIGSSTRDEQGEDARGSSAISGALHGHLGCHSIVEEGRTVIVIGQKKVKADKKLDPFRVLVEETPREGQLPSISFAYDGDFKREDQVMDRVMEAIVEALKQDYGWLGVRDLKDLGVGREKTIRDALRFLTKNGTIEVRERDLLGEAKKRTLVGKGNEKLFALPESEADE